MTAEQMKAEIMYQRSVAPFVQMEKDGVISKDDLRAIVTILAEKYRPVFVHYIVSN
jgi:lysozyme family protein